MSEDLFRKESMEHIKSPEQTEDYLKVSHPSAWLVVLAAAFFVWGFFGQIPVRLPAAGVVENGEITIFLSAEDVLSVNENVEILIDGIPHKVTQVSNEIISADDLKAQYGELKYYQLKPAEWNFQIKADATGVADGVKSVSVVTDKIPAITYLFQQKTTVQPGVDNE